MNVTPSLLAQPLQPEQWIVCIDDARRRAGIEADLAEASALYTRWRLRHGLVGFVAPGELEVSVQNALASGAREVRVFHDLPSGAIHPWLGAPLNRENRRRLRIRRLTGPSVAPLVRELSRPDGLVEAGWLFDGRRSRPALDGTGQDASFIDEEAKAFAEWAGALVDLLGEAELDVIYGSAPTALEMPDPEKATADDLSPVAPVVPFPSTPKALHSPPIAADPRRQPFQMDLDSLPLAASSEREAMNDLSMAAHAGGAAPGVERLLMRELRPESGSLRAPPVPDGRVEVFSRAEPGEGSRHCLTVEVSLWGPRWAGRDELVLALVPRTQRPLLLRLSAPHLPADTAWGEATYGEGQRRWVTLRRTVELSVAEALRGGTIELHDFTDNGAAAPAAHADGPDDV